MLNAAKTVVNNKVGRHAAAPNSAGRHAAASNSVGRHAAAPMFRRAVS